MELIKVLFICVHNSARSQMAEAFLNSMASKLFYAQSAGIEPGELSPLVVEVMKEEGIDISSNKTKSVFDFYKKGELFNYVITVCDQVNAQKCPTFSGNAKVIHWSFEDPSQFKGLYEERFAKTKVIRDKIKLKIEEWIKEISDKES